MVSPQTLRLNSAPRSSELGPRPEVTFSPLFGPGEVRVRLQKYFVLACVLPAVLLKELNQMLQSN